MTVADIPERVIPQELALSMGFEPITVGIRHYEYWMLLRFMQDMERGGIEWRFVESRAECHPAVALWRKFNKKG